MGNAVTIKQNTLCYLEKGDSYLMLHRVKKQNDVNKDKWIGVGGGFEAGESPEDCMKREIFEETGFTAKEWRYRGIVTFASDIYPTEYMHLFTVTDWEGEQKVCDEGDLVWVEKERVLSLPSWEGDRIFLALLWEERPFFSLKLTYQGEKLVGVELDGANAPAFAPIPISLPPLHQAKRTRKKSIPRERPFAPKDSPVQKRHPCIPPSPEVALRKAGR